GLDHETTGLLVERVTRTHQFILQAFVFRINVDLPLRHTESEVVPHKRAEVVPLTPVRARPGAVYLNDRVEAVREQHQLVLDAATDTIRVHVYDLCTLIERESVNPCGGLCCLGLSPRVHVSNTTVVVLVDDTLVRAHSGYVNTKDRPLF